MTDGDYIRKLLAEIETYREALHTIGGGTHQDWIAQLAFDVLGLDEEDAEEIAAENMFPLENA